MEITHAEELLVVDCVFTDNLALSSTALLISSARCVQISECMFSNNSLALSTFHIYNLVLANSIIAMNAIAGISMVSLQNSSTYFKMKNCSLKDNAGAGLRIKANSLAKFEIDMCTFEGNKGRTGDAPSALHVRHGNITLRDVNIVNNSCSGVQLLGSTLTFENTVRLAGNSGQQGGALSLKSGDEQGQVIFSKLILLNSSKVYITNIFARKYGGGIYSEESCRKRNEKMDCFFQFNSNHSPKKALIFSGNSAHLGGESIFGGCLSNCFIEGNKKIDKEDGTNIMWDLILINGKPKLSQSVFVDSPSGIVCKNLSTNGSRYSVTTPCNRSLTVSVHPGEPFTIPLMVSDDSCFPSTSLILAKITEGSSLIEHGEIIKSRKGCYNFSFSVTGGVEHNATKIQLDIEKEDLSVTGLVVLKECPIGFENDTEGKCSCKTSIKLYKIECYLQNYSLGISPQTWMGPVSTGAIAVQTSCKYCKNKGTTMIAEFGREDSDKLCIYNRTGVMCGNCTMNYSLQLGGFNCADCSNSTYKGILLFIAFAIVGIGLVLLLFGLNLTVSTGLMNGLIFYSNIVYLNGDVLLLTRSSSNAHLQNAVRFLSTFLAWMNLDFGIATCFFDGYNTYVSTWMQFVLSGS